MAVKIVVVVIAVVLGFCSCRVEGVCGGSGEGCSLWWW